MPLGADSVGPGAARTRIDVENYVIDAEINPAAQTLKATVQVRFTPLDDINVATFELNNALNVSKVTDASGRQIPASRNQQEFTIRLSFPGHPAEGQAQHRHLRLRRQADGRGLAGLRHQVRRHQERHLLPDVSRRAGSRSTNTPPTASRRTCASRCPPGYTVIAPGIGDGSDRTASGLTAYRFKYTQPSFPASLAVVQGEPTEGAVAGRQYHPVFPRAQGHGAGVRRRDRQDDDLLHRRLRPAAAGQPDRWWRPRPARRAAIRRQAFSSCRRGQSASQVNQRVLANQIARQWWGVLMSPATRNHLWLINGNARYAEFLWIEQQNGPGAMEADVRDAYTEALTVTEAAADPVGEARGLLA